VEYTIRDDVFDLAPDFVRAVVVIRAANNLDQPEGLIRTLRERIATIAGAGTAAVDEHIQAWRNAYKAMPGTSKDQVRPSIDNLVRRIHRGGGDRIPFISSLVAISNLVSLSYLAPSGLVDADRVRGDLVLGPATGTESFTPFGRDDAVPVPLGEIIYYDSPAGAVLCRGWNSQGGQATGIRPTTSRAVLDVDGLTSVLPLRRLTEAAEYAAGLARDFCAARTEVAYLSRAQPTFTID
jgi:DNA/RNA-binding domain of Phe-tRNA-synthetase-like protein